jgi:hypothetical protein
MLWGCVCDSSWDVGLGQNQVQGAEWFGPDCSLRHCPSGDDPLTSADETAGSGILCGDSSLSVGAHADNLCHVECSNRGVCDYETGVCACFEGFGEVNCASRVG